MRLTPISPRPRPPRDRITAAPSSISACPAPRPPAAAVAPAAARAELLRRRTGQTGMRRRSRCSTISTGWGHDSIRLGRSRPARGSSSSIPISPGPLKIIEGLTKLGLNPRDIKYVIISHAHGDHDQGAAELQKRYGAKVVMGAPDWEATLQRPATAAGGVPKRDIAVGPDGTKLTLGDTTVEIVATPGHTPGTLSYVFPVKDQGRTVVVAYSGGTLTGAFGTDGARWDEYVASQRKIAKAAADAGASVLVSNHSEYDGAYTKARLLSAPRQPGESHPFVVGTESVQRYFTVMAECAMASKLRVGAR